MLGFKVEFKYNEESIIGTILDKVKRPEVIEGVVIVLDKYIISNIKGDLYCIEPTKIDKIVEKSVSHAKGEQLQLQFM